MKPSSLFENSTRSLLIDTHHKGASTRRARSATSLLFALEREHKVAWLRRTRNLGRKHADCTR